MGKPKRTKHLEDPGIDGKIILKRIFEKWEWRQRIDRYGSGEGQVAGCCEFCDASSGSIKRGEFIFH